MVSLAVCRNVIGSVYGINLSVCCLGGPASLLLAFTLTGVMMYCTVQALGELAVLFPVAGSFAAYSTRFLDPAWGFAMGWNYAMQWLVVLPLEIVSASITVDYWVSLDPRTTKNNGTIEETLFANSGQITTRRFKISHLMPHGSRYS